MREKNRSIYRVGFFLTKIMGENNVNTCTRKRMKNRAKERDRENNYLEKRMALGFYFYQIE